MTASASKVTVYSPNQSTYTTFTIDETGTPLTPGDATSETDIYVTYAYDATNSVADLTGSTVYNIRFGTNTLGYDQGWGDRATGVPDGNLTQGTDYVDDVSAVMQPNNHSYCFAWELQGCDPYHILLTTHSIQKNRAGALMYSGKNAMWMTPRSVSRFTNNDFKDRFFIAYTLLPRVPGEEATKGYGLMPVGFTQANGTMTSSSLHAPNGSGLYPWIKVNASSFPSYEFTEPASAQEIKLWPMDVFRAHITTPSGRDLSYDLLWSKYAREERNMDGNIPTELPLKVKRKYCSYDFFFSDADHTNRVLTYRAAYEADNADSHADGYTDIYVKYTPVMPFEASTDYTTATWYPLWLNKEKQYVSFWDETQNEFRTLPT